MALASHAETDMVIDTLVLGIGNTLLTDEGAGIHVLELLRREHADALRDVELLDGGTLSFSLLAWVGDCRRLIVLDAAQLGAPAGAVEVFEGADMDRFIGSVKRSPHEVSLLDLLDIARLTDSLPPNRALVGIQPAVVDWGERPGQAVSAALPQAAAAVLAQLNAWSVAEPEHESPPEAAATQTPPAQSRTLYIARNKALAEEA
jgi:hydrogenase maturation protease